jgi:hypothetical protein
VDHLLWRDHVRGVELAEERLEDKVQVPAFGLESLIQLPGEVEKATGRDLDVRCVGGGVYLRRALARVSFGAARERGEDGAALDLPDAPGVELAGHPHPGPCG